MCLFNGLLDVVFALGRSLANLPLSHIRAIKRDLGPITHSSWFPLHGHRFSLQALFCPMWTFFNCPIVSHSLWLLFRKCLCASKSIGLGQTQNIEHGGREKGA